MPLLISKCGVLRLLVRSGIRFATSDTIRKPDRLFITNIPETVDWKQLKDHCRALLPDTTIAYCSVSKDMATGIGKGHGLVQVEDPSAFELAIQKINGSMLNGSKLFARMDVKNSNGAPKSKTRRTSP
jgi:RNA recognition motif-containing protein